MSEEQQAEIEVAADRLLHRAIIIKKKIAGGNFTERLSDYDLSTLAMDIAMHQEEQAVIDDVAKATWKLTAAIYTISDTIDQVAG